MNVRWRERKGENYTGVHVAVCATTCVCMCVCAHAFMRGICSTFIQDKCTLLLAPSLSPHSVSFLFQKRDESSIRSHHEGK